MKGFVIQKAEQGGHFVQCSATAADPGMYRGIIFAGTLDECLAFIKAEFEKEGETK